MAIKEKSDRLGTKKAVYLASVGTLLLSAIMVMLPVISASFGSMSESATLFYSVDGPESLNTVLMLMLLGATALSALGLYTTKEFSKAHLIFGFVMRVIVLFLLIICKAYNDDKASFFVLKSVSPLQAGSCFCAVSAVSCSISCPWVHSSVASMRLWD